MDELTDSNIEERLIEWSETKEMLKRIKMEEMEMRLDLVAFLSDNQGVGNYRRGFPTIIAKAKVGVNHKIDEDLLALNVDDFSDLEREAVRYKANLSLASYKKIPEALRTTLDDCLIVTLAAPTLTVDYRGPENEDV